METLRPENPQALAEALASAAREGKQIRTGGAFTKDAFGGPLAPADVVVSTAALNRVIQYDPRDLTVSVEAGMPYAELSRLLAENRQMLPLDPPLGKTGTVGGVVASNLSGPRRRLYGTARDLVIGMKFATTAGKLVETGGMVVKNVAGLDVAKLMIGSCGTLAAITSVNFRLHAAPPAFRTFLKSFDSAADVLEIRDSILTGVLQPAALDVLNPSAAARMGRSGFVLAAGTSGTPAVLDRYARELPGFAAIEGEEEAAFWRRVRNFAPEFLASAPQGGVARVSSVMSEMKAVLEAASGPAVARAGTGVSYICFERSEMAADWVKVAAARGWRAVVEWAPPEAKNVLDLWPAPGSDLAVMRSVKRMFDPDDALNRGRLYGRI